ncbi:MAG: agmatine deiminase family protein [Gammaproteobacteria bacterium]|nr:agmatine deiminase family protein [Gammaproteobacteria bacterium]MBU1654297.1 agmatine deiminase family protein [Gammaproteobacteria bacterium]MBU1961228.1 agmatine deiminase family protein [Gammaproteobacteria bacterium]
MTRRLPAEWEPQDGVMMTWPHDGGDWAPCLQEVEPVFVRIAVEIAKRERLLAVCRDEPHRRHVQDLLDGAGVDPDRVSLPCIPSDDTWARDHGPITVIEDGQPQLRDFIFNGWGGKFEAGLDTQITSALHAQGVFGDWPLQDIKLVLEGGGIETDGQGTLLVTRRCLLSETRNPGMIQERMETLLTQYLGVKRFLWINEGGMEGDDTDGHIDTLVRFSDPGTLLYQACDDLSDPNFGGLRAMEAELQTLRDAVANPYRLIPLPSTRPIRNAEGDQLPASYANFLIVNGAVLAPIYREPADAIVLERLAAAFPAREIVPIDCRPLILQHGSLHCVTMQLPKGVLAP